MAKLSRCLTKHYAMKTYGRVDIWIHILTSELVGGEWSALVGLAVLPRGKSPGTHSSCNSRQPQRQERKLWQWTQKLLVVTSFQYIYIRHQGLFRHMTCIKSNQVEKLTQNKIRKICLPRHVKYQTWSGIFFIFFLNPLTYSKVSLS
jgi:hypothetical protein